VDAECWKQLKFPMVVSQLMTGHEIYSVDEKSELIASLSSNEMANDFILVLYFLEID
jgi:hypothetical protein